jgi:hypothetical protein
MIGAQYLLSGKKWAMTLIYLNVLFWMIFSVCANLPCRRHHTMSFRFKDNFYFHRGDEELGF